MRWLPTNTSIHPSPSESMTMSDFVLSLVAGMPLVVISVIELWKVYVLPTKLPKRILFVPAVRQGGVG